MEQWLRLCASTAGDAGLIPGQGTKILHALWPGQKKKKDVFGAWQRSSVDKDERGFVSCRPSSPGRRRGSSKEMEEWPEVEGEPGEIEVLGTQGRRVTKDE